jgi:N6-adenosine-specific RNA methylase IME4
MSTETITQQKFKPGDRVLSDLNNPKWPKEDHTDALKVLGTIVEYQLIPGTVTPLVPFVKWDEGPPGYSREDGLEATDIPAPPPKPTKELAEAAIAVVAEAEAISASPGLIRLAQLEDEIESAKRQAQRAAFEIKEDRLWKEAGYDSFCDYCKKRWGWEKTNAYDMAIAGGTINRLLDSGIPESEIPESTSALTEIAQVEPSAQATVLQETQARDGKVTASGVKKTLRHTPSKELIIALYSQIGTVTTPFTASHSDIWRSPDMKMIVSGPLFDEPLEFLTIKEAQQHWELSGQRLCAAALNNYPPSREAKRSLAHVPVKITSSGRNEDIGKRAFLGGDWSDDAEDINGNTPRPWDYPLQLDGSPYLRSIHLFQVRIDWQDTCYWQPPGRVSAITQKPAQAEVVAQQRLGSIYSPDDERGQAKSAIAAQLPTLAPFPTGNYSLIVADPPWKYSLRETDASHRGRTPYPTMTDKDILTLPMLQLAAEDSYILLWATNAHLPLAFDCLACWGYEYKNIHTWVKQSGKTGNPQIGLGHYGRNCTEHFLVGVKGNPGAWSSLGLTDVPTVLFESRQEHSKKPTQFWELAQALNVKLGGEAIELFARGDRAGWDTWGLEA